MMNHNSTSMHMKTNSKLNKYKDAKVVDNVIYKDVTMQVCKQIYVEIQIVTYAISKESNEIF